MRLLVITAGLAFAGTSVRAATSAWLDFGGDIKGESVQAGHKDWIEISGSEIHEAQSLKRPGAFALVKSVDRASPLLLSACVRGTKFDQANLDLFYPTSQPQSFIPVRVRLEGVVITYISTSGAGERPMESVGLMFEKIVYSYATAPGKEQTIRLDFVKASGSLDGESLDADNDGLPDSWEEAHGLPVGSNDANADPDGDGFTNLQEYQLGTDPKSGASFFSATLATSDVPGSYQLSWNSVPGTIYRIEWSPDLTTPFATIQEITASNTTTTLPVARPGNVGFYRVSPR